MEQVEEIRPRGLIVPHPAHKDLFKRITWVLLVLMILCGGLFYIFAQQRLDDEYFKAHSQIKSVMEMLLPWMLSVYSVGIIATSALTFMISKRLSGPLVNFKKSLSIMASGDFREPISLRKNDEYHELADGINQLQRTISIDYQNLNSAFTKLEKEWQAMPGNPEMPESMRRIRNILAERKYQ